MWDNDSKNGVSYQNEWLPKNVWQKTRMWLKGMWL
jgi:hypothetical protein